MTPHPMQPPTPQPPAEPFALPHKVDKFRLLRPLGRGGMGQVYLAYDEMLERQVALKFVASKRPGLEQRERFLIEARAIARIHHPNVVTIYSVGEYDGIPYLVSEYVDGCSLAQVGKPLPSPKVLRIAIELARGLDAAHQRGVLHRDVKPGNILLSKTDEVKLVDFGLAKLRHDNFGIAAETLFPVSVVVHRSPPSADLAQTISLVEKVAERSRNRMPQHIPALSAITHPGARMGTPLYMAPELWRGEQGTARSDIYSLGAVLYELAYGRPPHEAPSAAQLECLVLDTDAVPLLHRAPSLDPQLAQIIDSCLRRSPAERPSSAQELCAQLETLGMPDEVSSVPDGNPYRGLRPFEPTDRGLLFGRRQDVASVVDQLRMQPFVLITGDSGVGKSSLCRAGVLPSIRDGVLNEERNWSILSMIPGRWPLHAMADALGPLLRIPHGELVTALANEPAKLTIELSRKLGTHYGLLLFIDQLEEVVTQSSPADARLLGEFLSHLTQRLPGVRVLAAVRGDFLTRVAERTHLSYELSHAVYLLRPLTTPDLREVIEGPARIKGVRFENEAMIESMVRSTESAQGGLPLLQFTLAQLWEKRDVARGIILESSLKEIGGVEGSLSSYTESVLTRMLPEQVEAARRILIRLVRSDGTRICRTEEELVTGDPAELIALDVLVQSRLLVAKRQSASTNSYELAHESLFSGWSRLRDWLSHDREQRAVLERAEAAAQEWERFGHRNDLLWREPQILEFDRVCAESPSDSRSTNFLSSSRKSVRRQRLGRLGTVSSILAILVVFYVGRERESAALRLNQRAADVELMARQAGHEIEALAMAVRLAADNWSEEGIPAVVHRALQGVLMVPGRVLPGLPHSDVVSWVEYSPDGKQLASASVDGCTRLWAAETGHLQRTLVCHAGAVRMVRYSQDGNQIATIGDDGKVCIFNRHTAEKQEELVLHAGPIRSVSFSRDGQKLLTAGSDSTAVLYLLGTQGRRKQTLRSNMGEVHSAVFSPDSSMVATGGEDGILRIWSARDGKLARAVRAHEKAILILNFAPSGTMLVSGGADHQVQVWDTKDWGLRARVVEHRSPVVAAAFSPDSRRVLTAANGDISARLWDAETGVRLVSLDGHAAPLRWAAFSLDGIRIATMGMDHIVRVWHGETGTLLATYRGHKSVVVHSAFRPNSYELATAGEDHTVHVWREQLGRLSTLYGHTKPVWDGAFSRDGKLAITVSGDGTARLWNTETAHFIEKRVVSDQVVATLSISPDGRWFATAGFGTKHNAFLWSLSSRMAVAELSGHTDRVKKIEFSPDGGRLLTIGYDGTAKIWEVPSGKLLLNLVAGSKLYAGNFAPDGTALVTAGIDGNAQVWDAASGKLLHRLKMHTAPIWTVVYSPDGRWLATMSEDHTTCLWDPKTGTLKHVFGSQVAGARGHTDWVTSGVFSPTGKIVLTASMDGTATGWDIDTGRSLFSLIGHREGIFSIQYSPDGKKIVTTSADQTARVWDAKSHELLDVLTGHMGPVFRAAFSPDSKLVLTVSIDQTARIYAVTSQMRIQQACNILLNWNLPRPQSLCQ